ncbi:MAG: tRNA lysidine(34) synthetase TilS [Aestuariivirga sp.]
MRAAKLEKLKLPFAIAVSGGGDSMALLRLAHAMRKDFVALTVDHALRQSSAAEARKVKRWCKALGVEHHTLKWRHGKVATGLQAKARNARYDLMTAWCAKHGITTLLTAHTADDQAETVAMRMKRTSSPASLAGIWPEAEWNNIRILRTLLSKRRKALRSYLVSHGQEWIEDESNSNEKFERVRIRNAAPNIALAIGAAKAQKLVTTAKREAKSWMAKNLMVTEAGMVRFSTPSFATLKDMARDEVLQKIISICGGAATELAKRHELVNWLNKPDSSRRTLGRVVFAKTKNEICAAREAARIDAKPQLVSSSKSVIWDNRFCITAPKGSSIVAKMNAKGMKRNDKLPFYVDQTLPVVRLPNSILVDAIQSPSAHVSAIFIKK